MSYYDWKPVINSLLRRLKKHKCKVTRVNDGGEDYYCDFANAIVAVDECTVYVDTPQGSAWIAIVLGNDASEVISDYSVPIDQAHGGTALDSVCEEHCDEWENRQTPLKKDRIELTGPAGVKAVLQELADRSGSESLNVWAMERLLGDLPDEDREMFSPRKRGRPRAEA